MSMDTPHHHSQNFSKEEQTILVPTRTEHLYDPDQVPFIGPPPFRARACPPIITQRHHFGKLSSAGSGVSPASAGPSLIGRNFPRSPNGFHSPAASARFPSTSSSPRPDIHYRASSASFLPSSPSTPSSSFPITPRIPSSPHTSSLSQNGFHLPSDFPRPTKRHQRNHSRNLSFYFPRSGSAPDKIAEFDQEQVPDDEEAAPGAMMPTSATFPPSGGSRGPPTPLNANFTFGSSTSEGGNIRPRPSCSSRSGHHHKHSLSHNFFSFLEPGSVLHPSPEEELHTEPTPVPVSPWTSISSQRLPSTPTVLGSSADDPKSDHNGYGTPDRHERDEVRNRPGVVAVGFFQLALGAWLWVSGQQTGSLSLTGLGYWVVFDAFGVGLRGFLPHWLSLRPHQTETPSRRLRRHVRRSYGNGPVETVLMFAQAVYLVFSAVYVCKETLEHLLLTGSAEEGHHHHYGDEDGSLPGIDFPVVLAFITLISLVVTSLVYDNHSKLVDIMGNRISSFQTIIRSFLSSSRSQFPDPPPTSPLGKMFSNPFTCSPLCFCIALFFGTLFIPTADQRTFDMILAAVISLITFVLGYQACIIIGTVLMQTSPARGSSSGKMEAFLRAMREIERHPQVLHLPAPHIWQLTPSPSLYLPATCSKGSSLSSEESLVVTLELHVQHDLGDDEVLALTSWAWEKCAVALGDGKSRIDRDSPSPAPEVTVGVVRG